LIVPPFGEILVSSIENWQESQEQVILANEIKVYDQNNDSDVDILQYENLHKHANSFFINSLSFLYCNCSLKNHACDDIYHNYDA
jgi:hypothetical protein